ncbi:MAG: hypothetical protein AAGI37_12605 [Planctomycetota bacterium]
MSSLHLSEVQPMMRKELLASTTRRFYGDVYNGDLSAMPIPTGTLGKLHSFNDSETRFVSLFFF